MALTLATWRAFSCGCVRALSQRTWLQVLSDLLKAGGRRRGVKMGLEADEGGSDVGYTAKLGRGIADGSVS